jgi:hypothetical protein
LSDAAIASPSEGRRVAAGLVAFAVALALALVAATTLRSGPKLTSSIPSIDVAGDAMQVVRGRGHSRNGELVLEALGSGATGVLLAPTAPFAAAEYSRATWAIPLAAPPGAEFAMAWQTREQPGRTFTEPILDARGNLDVDLRNQPDWRGTIQGVGLVVRGRLDAPLVVSGLSLRSNAWDATLTDILGQWIASPFQGRRTSIGQMSFEGRFVAPPLAVVAAAVVIAVLWLGLRAWRRKEPVSAISIVVVLLAGWLTLDLRWQSLLWREHAASVERFAGRTLDQKHASADDAQIFEVARRIRDADRPRPARIVVLSDNPHLRSRVAWFLYPENVATRGPLRNAPPSPQNLRSGDQVVLLLYSGLSWDRERRLLVWADGRTRGGREILSDGPAFAVVEVE